MKYLFDQVIALHSLLFTVACAGSFAVCYLLLYRVRKCIPMEPLVDVDLKHCRGELLLLNVAGMVSIAFGLVLVFTSRLDFHVMMGMRADYSFFYEFRVFFLILLAHLLLNVPLIQVLARRELRSVRWIAAVYLLMALLVQARSAVFELAMVIVFAQLMWVGDKVKFKYVLFAVGALLAPNLIVLGRLGIPDDPWVMVDGLFSFEYSIMTSNLLAAAIDTGIDDDFSFVPTLLKVIPSPLRTLFGLNVVQATYYEDVADAAGITGGGFSLLAEMYSNFGWGAPAVFGLLGFLLGRMNSQAARAGRVKLLYAAAPLLYVSFILSFRNDFGVFLKYAVQLFVISLLLNVMLRNRLGK